MPGTPEKLPPIRALRQQSETQGLTNKSLNRHNERSSLFGLPTSANQTFTNGKTEKKSHLDNIRLHPGIYSNKDKDGNPEFGRIMNDTVREAFDRMGENAQLKSQRTALPSTGRKRRTTEDNRSSFISPPRKSPKTESHNEFAATKSLADQPLRPSLYQLGRVKSRGVDGKTITIRATENAFAAFEKLYEEHKALYDRRSYCHGHAPHHENFNIALISANKALETLTFLRENNPACFDLKKIDKKQKSLEDAYTTWISAENEYQERLARRDSDDSTTTTSSFRGPRR